jgi:hypothetical protein
MLPKTRALAFIYLFAALLGFATPFVGGLLSWGYLEPSSRVGFWYYWLYAMPDNFVRLLPYTPSPGGRWLVSAAGYATLYLAAVLAGRGAWYRLRTQSVK